MTQREEAAEKYVRSLCEDEEETIFPTIRETFLAGCAFEASRVLELLRSAKPEEHFPYSPDAGMWADWLEKRLGK